MIYSQEFDVGYSKAGIYACRVCAIGGGPCESGRSKGIVKLWNLFQQKGIIEAADGSGEFEMTKRDLCMLPHVVLKEGEEVCS